MDAGTATVAALAGAGATSAAGAAAHAASPIAQIQDNAAGVLT
jgi:hypothetical protein